MRRLSKDELTSYVDCDDWRGKAGGYAIQGKAAQYIKQINWFLFKCSWFRYIYYVKTFTRSWAFNMDSEEDLRLPQCLW